MLGHTGDTVVGGPAAERVQQRVVPELAVTVRAGHGDRPALQVHRGHARHARPYPGAREHVGEPPGREFPARRELVHAHPLDEDRLGVDDGDLGVGGREAAGEAPGGEGPGVTGAEDEDAVLHGVAPV